MIADFSAKLNVNRPPDNPAQATRIVTGDAAAIALRLRSHDVEVIHELIETHQHRLMRYLMFLTRNRDESEDLFQEVWLRVLRSGSTYDGRSAFHTWLSAIARNLVRDVKRRRPIESLDQMRSCEIGEFSFEITDTKPSVLDELQMNERAIDLHIAMENLHPSHQEILMLRFSENLALEEMAGLMGMPLSSVKSRLYRGIAALKLRLEVLGFSCR